MNATSEREGRRENLKTATAAKNRRNAGFSSEPRGIEKVFRAVLCQYFTRRRPPRQDDAKEKPPFSAKKTQKNRRFRVKMSEKEEKISNFVRRVLFEPTKALK